MKEDTRNGGKLAIRPDHPRRRIKIKLCMVGGLRCVVIHVKCDPNRLRGYGAVGDRKWPFPITLAIGLYNSLYYRTSRDNIIKLCAWRHNMPLPPASWQYLRIYSPSGGATTTGTATTTTTKVVIIVTLH